MNHAPVAPLDRAGCAVNPEEQNKKATSHARGGNRKRGSGVKPPDQQKPVAWTDSGSFKGQYPAQVGTRQGSDNWVAQPLPKEARAWMLLSRPKSSEFQQDIE